MKKTLSIICILITSALVAFFWVKIDSFLTRKNHPLEYSEYVEKYASEYAVPKELVYGVIKTESDFKSDAVSHKGAVGLMQIMPETYIWLCEKNSDENDNPDLLYTPEVNIRYGVFYLSMLYSQFGNWENALAAYNAGPGNVAKYKGVPPFKITQNFIKNIKKERENFMADEQLQSMVSDTI